MFLFKLFYRWATKRALRQVVQGRMKEPDKPEAGRLLPTEIHEIYEKTFSNLREILSEKPLDGIPTLGNRHNLLLAVLTVSIYHALLEAGLSRQRARVLLADAGWKLYVMFLTIPKTASRLLSRDPQRRMNIIIKMFLRFPFSAPGRPGYEVQLSELDDRFLTTWTFCPPYQFVKQYVENHGDHGEVKAFQQSWCWFDWALGYAMMEGETAPGYSTSDRTPYPLGMPTVICAGLLIHLQPPKRKRIRRRSGWRQPHKDDPFVGGGLPSSPDRDDIKGISTFPRFWVG